MTRELVVILSAFRGILSSWSLKAYAKTVWRVKWRSNRVRLHTCVFSLADFIGVELNSNPNFKAQTNLYLLINDNSNECRSEVRNNSLTMTNQLYQLHDYACVIILDEIRWPFTAYVRPILTRGIRQGAIKTLWIFVFLWQVDWTSDKEVVDLYVFLVWWWWRCLALISIIFSIWGHYWKRVWIWSIFRPS